MSVIFFQLLLGLTSVTDDRDNDELIIINNFPEYDEHFMERPHRFALSEDYIYTVDMSQHVIHKFSKDGTYLEDIGREGSGPEEFERPYLIDYQPQNNMLYVVDQGNRRMQMIDKTTGEWDTYAIGDYIPQSFIVNDHIYKFSADLLAPAHRFKLIESFDVDGNKVATFGHMHSYREITPAFLNRPHYAIHNNDIFIAFHFLPYLQVYDKQGELIKDIKLEHPHYEEGYEYNTSREPHQGSGFRPKGLFRGFSIVDDDYFFALSEQDYLADGNLLIDQFDRDGQFVQRYEKTMDLDFIFDVKVTNEDDQLKIYLLAQQDDIPQFFILTPAAF